MKNKWEFDVLQAMAIGTVVHQNLVQQRVSNLDPKKTWFLSNKSHSSNLLQKCARFCWANMGREVRFLSKLVILHLKRVLLYYPKIPKLMRSVISVANIEAS